MKITMPENTINIFTDGACSNNPGKGGAAAILKYKEHTKCIQAYLPLTTNNQMEMIACIIALKALKKPSSVTIYTDSIYVQKGITEWIKKWQVSNWKGAGKQPVKNVELWQELLNLTKIHTVTWKWIKGHAGHPENEEADNLARNAITKESPLLDDFLFLSFNLGHSA